jgi:hypothetical protein
MSDETGQPRARDERLQAYLDGTLPRRAAVELFLQAERDPALRAELDGYRTLFGQLDALPRAEPPAALDRAVLTRVPYDYYRSLPQRPAPVLQIGSPAPSVARRLAPLRGWAVAAGAAYGLFLLVSHSLLARGARTAAAVVGNALADLAARTHDVPVLAALLTALQRIYEIGLGAISAVHATLGSAGTTLAVGLVVALLVVLAVVGLRRREDPGRSHV